MSITGQTSLPLYSAGRSDPGRERDHNEDYFLTPELAQVPPAVRQQRGELVMVADGMGGHAAGEVAARMTVERVVQGYYGSQAPPFEPLIDSLVSSSGTLYAIHRQQQTRLPPDGK